MAMPPLPPLPLLPSVAATTEPNGRRGRPGSAHPAGAPGLRPSRRLPGPAHRKPPDDRQAPPGREDGTTCASQIGSSESPRHGSCSLPGIGRSAARRAATAAWNGPIPRGIRRRARLAAPTLLAPVRTRRPGSGGRPRQHTILQIEPPLQIGPAGRAPVGRPTRRNRAPIRLPFQPAGAAAHASHAEAES